MPTDSPADSPGGETVQPTVHVYSARTVQRTVQVHGAHRSWIAFCLCLTQVGRLLGHPMFTDPANSNGFALLRAIQSDRIAIIRAERPSTV